MFRLRRPARRRSEEFGTQHFGISEMSSTLDFSMRFSNPPMRTASEDRMKLSSQNLKPRFGNSDCGFEGDARSALVSYLARRHPTKAPEAIAAETAGVVSAAAARKMLSQHTGPCFENFLALINAYGAEFLVAVMGSDAPESLQLAALAERRQRYEEGVAELRAKCGIDDGDGERR
jgi:hypothetical protein